MYRVKLAVHKDTHECVAVKIVHVDDSSGLTHESLRKEVASCLYMYLLKVFDTTCAQICIMKMLRSEYVIRFFGQRTLGSTHYLFLEYADGGELFDRIGN